MPEKANGTAQTKTSTLPAAQPPSQTSDSEGAPKPDGVRPRRRRTAKPPKETEGAEAKTEAADDAAETQQRRKSKKPKTTEVASPLELIGMLTLESVRTGVPIGDLVDRYEAACAAFREATS